MSFLREELGDLDNTDLAATPVADPTHVLGLDGSTWKRATVTGGGGGGGEAGWTQVVDLPGDTVTGWTSVGSGSWSAPGGTHIQQATTGASYRGLVYDTLLDFTTGTVAEVEVRLPSSDSTALVRAMMALHSPGVVTTNHAPYFGLQKNSSAPTRAVVVQRGDQGSALTAAFTFDLDTWYRVRAKLAGQTVAVYVDDTFVASWRLQVAGDARADRLMLVSFGGVAHYRNLKVWTLDGPS